MTLNLLTIFGTGLLTFLTPCVLPLVPLYLASLAGGDLKAVASLPRAQLLSRSALFSLGFLAVFTMLGMVASTLGQFLATWRLTIQTVGGVVVLLFGLKFLGIIQVPFLDRVLRADDRKLGQSMNGAYALLLGVLFAAAWSPCVGPVLGSVLTYTATTTTDPYLGALYLATYGAGIALPLLVTAGFAETGLRALRALRRGLPVFERALGALLVVVSSSLLFDLNLLPTPLTAGSAHAASAQPPRMTPPAEELPAMVELYAKDCPICQAMAPIVADVTAHCDGNGVTVRQYDVSTAKHRALIQTYRVVGVPTFLFFDAAGNEVARLVGEQRPEQLHQALAAVRGESCPGLGLLPTDAQPPPPDSIEENVTCPSTNTTAKAASSASTSSAKSLSAATRLPAQPAASPPNACSLASP